jgi:hypothetical protein
MKSPVGKEKQEGVSPGIDSFPTVIVTIRKEDVRGYSQLFCGSGD